MRHSLQRDTIKNVVCSTTCHPTADWVYNEVRKLIPNISLGTVCFTPWKIQKIIKNG